MSTGWAGRAKSCALGLCDARGAFSPSLGRPSERGPAEAYLIDTGGFGPTTTISKPNNFIVAISPFCFKDRRPSALGYNLASACTAGSLHTAHSWVGFRPWWTPTPMGFPMKKLVRVGDCGAGVRGTFAYHPSFPFVTQSPRRSKRSSPPPPQTTGTYYTATIHVFCAIVGEFGGRFACWVVGRHQRSGSGTRSHSPNALPCPCSRQVPVCWRSPTPWACWAGSPVLVP